MPDGASGSGKTTVLLCIAGLEKISAGTIRLGEKTLSAPGVHIPPEKRGVGMVFQDCALFPHLTVAGNIAFGLRANGEGGKAREKRVDEMAELCDISELRDAHPHELSGGEQQRAALARALAPGPELLLLDEPFSRLDEILRRRLSRDVRDILKSARATALLVTHNQQEAFAVADVGGVINQGAICQWDEVSELYRRPQCVFVADFVGDGAMISGKLVSDREVDGPLGRLSGDESAAGRWRVRATRCAFCCVRTRLCWQKTAAAKRRPWWTRFFADPAFFTHWSCPAASGCCRRCRGRQTLPPGSGLKCAPKWRGCRCFPAFNFSRKTKGAARWI